MAETTNPFHVEKVRFGFQHTAIAHWFQHKAIAWFQHKAIAHWFQHQHKAIAHWFQHKAIAHWWFQHKAITCSRKGTRYRCVWAGNELSSIRQCSQMCACNFGVFGWQGHTPACTGIRHVSEGSSSGKVCL